MPYAHNLAERWSLRFEEIPGSNAMVRQMLFGPWDDDFVVVSPGGSIRYEHFFPGALVPKPQHKEEVRRLPQPTRAR